MTTWPKTHLHLHYYFWKFSAHLQMALPISAIRHCPTTFQHRGGMNEVHVPHTTDSKSRKHLNHVNMIELS
ncbi:unnamed protein product, partial [Gulo gulo]